ncbi:MAG: hypothetical protein HY589_04060 [Candidatus Omnitrophica bacterium]|nr:hypothetical protein [Candidatus Omnitrophota bacterium]
MIAKVRKTGLTFAVEAGTERLRGHIGKDIDVEKIVLACGEAFRAGWRTVKFYFMIDLPTETEEDLKGIADFINRILGLDRGAGVSVSVASFVPKPNTAFENEETCPLDSILDKQTFLRGLIRGKRVSLKFHDARISCVERRLSRRDTRLSKVILAAWRKGSRLDAWTEFFKFDIWRSAFQETGFCLDLNGPICYTDVRKERES